MKDNNKPVDCFIGKAESISDNIIGKVYNVKLVEKIESLDFIKALINSSFINGIQNFGKSWFKQIFIILGYISIIGGILGAISQLIGLLDVLNNTWFLISGIINICLSLLSIIVGLGMIKFKKRFTFTTLVQGGLYILSIVISTIAVRMYFKGLFGIGNFSGVITNIIIFLFFYIIYITLVLKNKKLFIN